jgi:DNA adenine methylase
MTRQQSLFELREEFIEQNVSDDHANKVINIASVPMRSPFRYPGGKTWLVPYIRVWLRARGGSHKELIETFAGGGIVSLTAVFEQLVGQVTLVELDEDVAAVWQVITTGDAKWLADQIINFDLTAETAQVAIAKASQSLRDRAFATIVKNRVNRGGILAEGASFIKQGENGKGIRSRWYPGTLKHRIIEIDQLGDKIKFIFGDAFEILRLNEDRKDSLYFIDPPYVKAGARLYRHSTIDHLALFEQVSRLAGDFLMTYDDHAEIRELASGYGFETRFVAMKSTHHVQKNELLIGRDLSWL